jgi:4-hydroxyphenylpyruvate dioxygenase-like putative hemolysin
MAEQTKPRVQLPSVQQVGIVVRDVDRAVQYYSSTFGWGPFQVMELELKGFTYRGRRSDGRLKVALAQLGPIQIELVQVLEGKTPHSDFLKEKGEGIDHLLLGPVQDLNGTLAELAKDGIEPIFRCTLKWGDMEIDGVFLNSDRIGGVKIELTEVKQR